jgi:hypothetical protein
MINTTMPMNHAGGFRTYCTVRRTGEDSHVVAEAKSAIDSALRRKLKEHIEYLKEMIRNRVALQYREASGF